MSDTISIYSEKAYRREGGAYFEAVGNVVISSGKDTLYGEKATFNTKTGKIIIEGSVRFIGQNMTIYGSKILYNMTSKLLEMTNARMITPEFNMVSSHLVKKSESRYFARDAEFTTCRDCTESWLISGKKVHIEINKYIQVYHALLKVKGVDVLYLPYIALPIKNKRESGLLFPVFSSRDGEGLRYQQPIFWAMTKAKDMTITPAFLSERGYGLDLEYRQVFDDKKWVEFNNTMLNDRIYYPEELNSSRSGKKFFRHFFELESHMQWANDFNQHFYLKGVKDLDFFRDLSYSRKDIVTNSDIGLDFFLEKRFDRLSLTLETEFKRSLLDSNPLNFDSSYVQTLPALSFSIVPHILWQRRTDYFYKMTTGFEGELSVFKQNRLSEENYIRNAQRFDISPYLDLNILSQGPFLVKSKYTLDYQAYKFLEKDTPSFYKNAGLVSTEFSFTMDRIFGLAYQEEYDSSELSTRDLLKISHDTKKEKMNVLGLEIIGQLPKMEKSFTKETITVRKNSYRHAQEFKVIHHKLVNTGEAGNKRFLDQIDSANGWFDFRDAITENILDSQSSSITTQIPLNNTLELQWNNALVRKRSKKINYLQDNRYLKDNFTYSSLGHFNLSQGILLNTESDSLENNLTRLLVDTSYSASLWSVAFQDYFTHQSGDHILTTSGQKRFDRLSLLARYYYNSFPDSRRKNYIAGVQFRPFDILGFSFLSEHDLNADENVSSIYQIDLMPLNNCWIVSLNYKESFYENKYAINFAINYGDEEFKRYRNNFFSFGRI